MATVTFYTPTDMTDLAFPTISWGAASESNRIDTYISVPFDMHAVAYGSGLTFTGSGLVTGGTINTVMFDSNDSGAGANILISGLNYEITGAETFNYETEHLSVLLPALLAGADVFRGSSYGDQFQGFGGNDTFFGGGGGDAYDGGADRDTVSYAGASAGLFAGLEDAGFNSGLAAGDSYISIENLIGTSFNDILYGTGGANKLSAGAGNDLMVGKGGADTLEGGSGSDTVSYDSSFAGVRADLLTPSNNTGHAAGDRYLSIENLDGSGFNDRLYGNNSANILLGNTYHTPAEVDNDQLFGRGGNDILRGWAGNDTLEGGTGRDILIGGAGGDRFVLKTVGETGKTASTRDVITDFSHRNGDALALADTLDLSGIDANTASTGNQGFTFIARSAFSGNAGQLRFTLENNTGTANDRTIVQGDVNGDRIADFQIQLTGLKVLIGADFFL